MCLKSKASGGFTLIEILVVMVLMSIVTAFTLPSIRTNLYSDQLKATARRLVGFVTEVSQSAVSNQAEYSIKFDLDENRISASPKAKPKNLSGKNDIKQIKLAIPESVEIVDISVHDGDKYSQGKLTLFLSKKGYVNKTAIHLRDDDGRDMTVILSPFLGVVRIFDSYVELADDQARY